MTFQQQGREDPGVLLSKRALVSDGSRSSRELLRTILEDSGMKVEAVSCLPLVLEFALRFAPHIILLDVSSFDEEGRAAVAALRSEPLLYRTPLIALAATPLYPEPHTMTEAGFSCVLAKPITPSRLRRVVLQELASAGA